MSTMQGIGSAMDRSRRSVLVGNIPLEVTEEQLKHVFSKVGPVVSFGLIYDHETKNSKGYGICEYKDYEAAQRAIRHFNGFGYKGHALNVDSAASEKSKEELKNLQTSLGRPSVKIPSEPEVEPEKAPEQITEAVASLPPEQMFELMKQMKLCVQNDPNEARNLLLQNPQLAYALLQAQVVMKIVDPHVAMTILNRPLPTPQPQGVTGHNQPSTSACGVSDTVPCLQPNINPGASMPVQVNPALGNQWAQMPQAQASSSHLAHAVFEPTGHQWPPHQLSQQGMNVRPLADPRTMASHAMRQPIAAARPMHAAQNVVPTHRDMHQMGVQNFGHMSARPPPDNQPFDPRNQALRRGNDGRAHGGFERQYHAGSYDPRTAFGVQVPPGKLQDLRNVQHGMRLTGPSAGPSTRPSAGPPTGPSAGPSTRPGAGPSARPGAGPPTRPSAGPYARPSAGPRGPPQASVTGWPSSAIAAAASSIAPNDQEKAALIIQVLQLSDQQLATLPAEQRQSVMLLKEQIARSQAH